jgi:fatty acid-binding protein DegV
VQTSRPAPAEFAACYREALDAGADAVVSVHLYRELSGTWDAARLAAEEVDANRVRVVDSRAAAMTSATPCSPPPTPRRQARTEPGWRRPSRTSAPATACSSPSTPSTDSAAALLGTALAVKPLLHVVQGKIVPLEKVRTTARATERLVELATRAAGDGPVDIAVHHLGAAARAEGVAARLRERLAGITQLLVSEVGALIGAHVGLGLLGVVVVPHR